MLILAKKYLPEKAWVSIIGLCLLVSTLWTSYSNRVWKDKETYCTYWHSLNPLNSVVLDCQAEVYIEKNDKGFDKTHYKNCQEVASLANAFNFTSQYDVAFAYYLIALEFDQECVAAHYGLGELFINREDYPMAEKAFEAVIQINPQSFSAHEYLIDIYERQGKLQEAKRTSDLMNRVFKE